MGKGLASSQGPPGVGHRRQQWSEGSGAEEGGTAHSQAARARRPLLGHPSHRPGPAGTEQGQRARLAGIT